MRLGVIALALAAGVLSGMAAGGGTVLVPGLVLLFSVAQKQAQGAVLAAFLATQAAAAAGQWRQGNIKWKMAGWMAAGALVGALGGAWLAARTRPALLREVYGWYLIVLGAANLINFKQREKVNS